MRNRPASLAHLTERLWSRYSARCHVPARESGVLHIFLIGDEAASGEKYAQPRADVFKMWDDLNWEDISILKGMQDGRRCPGYQGGLLSPFWEEITLSYAQKIVEMIIEE